VKVHAVFAGAARVVTTLFRRAIGAGIGRIVLDWATHTLHPEFQLTDSFRSLGRA
jgi:hypothetical protein